MSSNENQEAKEQTEANPDKESKKEKKTTSNLFLKP